MVYSIHIPINISPKPEEHEISAAVILSRYFKCDIFFIIRDSHKSPDFSIQDVLWELKSPMGNGKRTVQRTLQTALRQSLNVIVDARRSKMHSNKIKSELYFQAIKTKKLKRLLLITKGGEVIEIK